MTDELKLRFLILASWLSPENLHCDGEISNAEANAKYRYLMKRWSQLERQAGQQVGEEDAWKWCKLSDDNDKLYYKLMDEENRLRWN